MVKFTLYNVCSTIMEISSAHAIFGEKKKMVENMKGKTKKSQNKKLENLKVDGKLYES
jgi:hypothetical protein